MEYAEGGSLYNGESACSTTESYCYVTVDGIWVHCARTETNTALHSHEKQPCSVNPPTVCMFSHLSVVKYPVNLVRYEV